MVEVEGRKLKEWNWCVKMPEKAPFSHGKAPEESTYHLRCWTEVEWQWDGGLIGGTAGSISGVC